MFQLIISILAIVLAVALAGISISYIGSAFSNGSETAQYATLVNEGVQIEGAMTLYRAQVGEASPDVATLTPDYLKQAPAGFTLNADKTYAVAADDDAVTTDRSIGDAVCDASDDTLTSTDTVAALVSDTAGSGSEGIAELNVNNAIHGCVKASDGNVFFYAL